MHCTNCGKELLEGEICTCTAQAQAPQEAPPQPQYIPPYPPQGYAPAPMPIIKPKASKDYPEGYKIKRKYVAVILAVALGVVGIHNFYLGNKEKAIAQLLIATIGSLLIIGPIITLVWSMVEAVQLLCEYIDADANGYKIQTFEEAIALALKDKE